MTFYQIKFFIILNVILIVSNLQLTFFLTIRTDFLYVKFFLAKESSNA